MSNYFSKAYCFIKQTFIGDLYRRIRYDKVLSSTSEAEKELIKFCGKDVKDKQEIISDMLDAAKKFLFGFDEFFLYNLRDKSDAERHEFISDREHLDIIRKINKARNEYIFDDKAETYKKFYEYYHRDVFFSWGGVVPASFQSFIEKHKSFIVKPLSSACGWGIQIINGFDDAASLWNDLTKKYCSKYDGGFIAEELIQQVDEMKRIHPESVNTVRITTLRMNDRVEIIYPFFRAGRGKNVVDNGGSGGLLCAIDKATGKVAATIDEDGNRYDIHPDTGLPLIGFQIPRWNEALNLAKELAQVVPSNRFTGWDLALTESGWIMVEGNARGQFVGWQIPYQRGFRREMEGYLKELGIKY